jgi:hypothetical protein
MKAKELIKKLQKLDPEMEIYTNQWMEADTNEMLVAKDKDTGECHAYIGDDLDELQYELEHDNYTTKRI